MKNVDVSPSDAIGDDALEDVADAANNHGAAEGGDTEISADDVGGSSTTSVSDALMHTEPDLSPEGTLEGFGTVETHAYIGVRKVLAAVGVGDGATEDGTPAIVNFAKAGLAYVFDVEEEEDAGDDDDGGDAIGGAGDADVDVESRADYHDPAAGGASA